MYRFKDSMYLERKQFMTNMHYERELQSQAKSVVICTVLGVYCRSYYLLFIRVGLGLM